MPHLVECCMRLHNFCINERIQEWFNPDILEDVVLDHQAANEKYIDELDAVDVAGHAGGHKHIRDKVRDAVRK